MGGRVLCVCVCMYACGAKSLLCGAVRLCDSVSLLCGAVRLCGAMWCVRLSSMWCL